MDTTRLGGVEAMARRLKPKTGKRILALLLFSSLAGNIWWPHSYACGPFFPEAVLISLGHPDRPWDTYYEGQLGVILPRFWRVHLLVAYRHLVGVPLQEPEIEGLKAFWEGSGRPARRPSEDSPEKIWMKARERVTATVGESPGIYLPTDYSYFVNCTDSAFSTAAQTLNERIATFGTGSAEVREWLRGQDRVFQNCSSTGELSGPGPAPAGLDPLIHQDRQYQIAAALFYQQRFDEALSVFHMVSQTPGSPWAPLAHLLVARCWIRKATLEAAPGESFSRPEMLHARDKLQWILSQPDLKQWHSAARDLLEFAELRIDPSQALHRIAQRLTSSEPNPRFTQDLIDFAWLMDGGVTSEDDLIEWIRTFQQASPQEAFDQWERSPGLPFLLAAASRASAGAPGLSQLLQALRAVPADSPGYLTAAFHLGRLLAASGSRDEARELIDQVLTRNVLPLSTGNLFRAMRLQLAENLADFRRYSGHRPTTIRYSASGRERPPEERELYFDQNSSRWLTESFPLKLLVQLASSNPWPARLSAEVAQAAWTRAVIFEDWEKARLLTPPLSRLLPESRAHLDEFQRAASDPERRFVSALILLRLPGLHAYVSAGPLRELPADRIDNFRHNWWCSQSKDSFTLYDHYQISQNMSRTVQLADPEFVSRPPAFLSAAEREQGEREWQQVSSLGAGPSLLASRVLDHALIAPRDPRLPEALHRAVKATRYGCTDARNSWYSRQAFLKLHRDYPSNPWTRKTPYWF